MPLTSKGKKILRSMRKQYGPKKAQEVFYASKNKGKISGVDEQMETYKHIGLLIAEAMHLMKKRSKGGNKDLASLYPPYDKITRGDVIAGRLKGKKNLTEGETKKPKDTKPKIKSKGDPKKGRYAAWFNDPHKRWWGPGPDPRPGYNTEDKLKEED